MNILVVCLLVIIGSWFWSEHDRRDRLWTSICVHDHITVHHDGKFARKLILGKRPDAIEIQHIGQLTKRQFMNNLYLRGGINNEPYLDIL